MADEPEDEELTKCVERWGIRLLSSIKAFCIVHDLNESDLKTAGFGFFDILVSNKVVLVAFRVPENRINPYFAIHWKGGLSTNELMDLSFNIVKEEDGRLSLFRMFDFSENISDSLFVAPGDIKVIGIGTAQRCYSGFLLMKHAVFYKKDPERLAVDFLRNANILNNIRRATSVVKFSERTFTPLEQLTKIAEAFQNLLRDSKKEEDVQHFLKENPILLYPEFIKKWDKLRLGDDMITDFVFLVKSHNGSEHIFVEIESPSKRIFRSDGLFSASYTQSKDQLLKWQIWIDRNRRYLEDKIGEIQAPAFHLIIGRSDGIDPTDRWKLKKDSSGSGVLCSTYDDILEKFKQTVRTLHT